MPVDRKWWQFWKTTDIERLDTEEDLRDRELMLDEVERSFYRHASVADALRLAGLAPKDGEA